MSFEIIMLISTSIFFVGIYRNVSIWFMGRRRGKINSFKEWLKNLTENGLANRRLLKRDRFSYVMHMCIMWGMILLLGGEILRVLEVHTPLSFLNDEFYLNYSLILDIAGISLITGVILDMIRRTVIGTARLDYTRDEAIILVLLLFIGITGFLNEGNRLYLLQPTEMDRSPFGTLFSYIFQSLSFPQVIELNVILYWEHIIAVAILIAYFPFSKLFHNIAAPINIIMQSGNEASLLSYFKGSEDEGVKKREELFTMGQLVMLDACTTCGICQSVCPAYEVDGEYFSPKRVVQSVKSYIKQKHGFSARYLGRQKDNPLLETHVSDKSNLREALWFCTNCWACIKNCPVLVNPVSFVDGIRGHMVEEGIVSRTHQDALTNTFRYGNPWGELENKRSEWAKGLEIKDLSKKK
ncbi:MAG: 4Fe-4S dicluster domain-containing protein [Candidatus Bathyarchaeia archaeon]